MASLNADDITIPLSIGVIDDEELAALLSRQFQHGSGNAQWVEYQVEKDQCAIRLIYKDGIIIRAERGPALTDDFLTEIINKIQAALIEEGASKVNRSIAFSLEELKGCWKYRDKFQIMPAPENAPNPEESYADHPFVIELRYAGSTESGVEQVRLERELYEVRLLLSLFVSGGVSWKSNVVRGTKEWVFVGGVENLHSEYLQPGYTVPGFENRAEDFSDTTNQPYLQEVDFQEYFKRYGVSTSPLTVPNNLTALFDAFYGLSREQREKFLRSCFWFYKADDAWKVTSSLHYSCLVTAIETLMGRSEKVPCPHCGKDTAPGPTGQFKTFLKTYTPGSHNSKDRDAFYALRSSLSHGSQLLKNDMPRAWGALHPTDIQEGDSGRNMRGLARVGMINWLLASRGAE